MKILPCPFCGSEVDVDGWVCSWSVYCTCCGAGGPTRATEKEAIEPWNRLCVTVSYGKIFRGAMYAVSNELEKINKELGEEEEDK